MITRNRKSSRKATTPTKNHKVNAKSNVWNQLKQCRVVLKDIGSRQTHVKDKFKSKPIISNIKPCQVVLNDISKQNATSSTSADLGDGKKSKSSSASRSFVVSKNLFLEIKQLVHALRGYMNVLLHLVHLMLIVILQT